MKRRTSDGPRGGGEHGEGTEILHTSFRGAVAAMSMSGMRILATRLGWLRTTPPEMVAVEAEEAPRVLRNLSPSARDAVIILMHWVYGAGGGATYGALPAGIRLKRWTGPLFGLGLWLFFEAMIVPAMGLRRLSKGERAVLAVDHLMYGAVLSELRTRPRR